MKTKAPKIDAVILGANSLVRRANQATVLRSMLRRLRDAAVNTPALDSSADWTALVEEADQVLSNTPPLLAEGHRKLILFAEAVEGLIAWAVDNGADQANLRALESIRRDALSSS